MRENSMSDVEHYELFIDGSFQEATTDENIEVSYPYTGEVWATVPRATATDINEAVSAARQAFFDSEWATWGHSQRRKVLNQIAEIFDNNADELARLETRQNGKLIREMRPQMDAVGDWYRYYARLCDDVGEARVNPVENKDGRMFNYVKKEPYGVVGAITPWNSPLLVTAWKLAPALAAGNTVVQKPSEETPVSALRFVELVYKHTDLPKGVYNVVPGLGKEAGAALAEHSEVDKLTFTGSTDVGREVAAKSGKNLTSVSLELGGKNPNIVFPSADLQNAVNGVMKGIFAASGQTCMAGSRVLVHDNIYEEFVQLLVNRAEDIKLGDPMDEDTELGPVAFRDQWEKVREYIELGNDEGATLKFGGDQPTELPGDCFIQPTIFVDVESDMRIAQEEIFGPVASIITFSSEEEAVDLANDTNYGLAAGVWTSDMNQSKRMIDQIRAGTIWVNEYRVASPYSPHGGFGDSGIGRENGLEGLEEYYQPKNVWIDHSGEVGDPFSLDAN